MKDQESKAKTPHCQHQGSCYANALTGFEQKFKYILAYKLCFNKLFVLKAVYKSKNLREALGHLLKSADIKDAFVFALVWALINGTYKLLLCLLRRHLAASSNPDRLAAPIAGFVSGLWLFLDRARRRQLIIVLAMSRAVEILVNQKL